MQTRYPLIPVEYYTEYLMLVVDKYGQESFLSEPLWGINSNDGLIVDPEEEDCLNRLRIVTLPGIEIDILGSLRNATNKPFKKRIDLAILPVAQYRRD